MLHVRTSAYPQICIPHYTPAFPYQTSWQCADGNPPPMGTSNAGGVCKNSQFSTNIWLLDRSLVKCEEQHRRSTTQFTAQTVTHQWILFLTTRGGSISPVPISIFLIQNIGNIVYDILYCRALWPTHIFHYCVQSSQWHQCYFLTSVLGFGLVET